MRVFYFYFFFLIFFTFFISNIFFGFSKLFLLFLFFNRHFFQNNFFCVFLVLNKAVKRDRGGSDRYIEIGTSNVSRQTYTKFKCVYQTQHKLGIWQNTLTKKSRRLTRFGRFDFNRLLFGISYATEVFQRTISKILEELEGVVCHVDAPIIITSTQEIPNELVREGLRRLKKCRLLTEWQIWILKPKSQVSRTHNFREWYRSRPEEKKTGQDIYSYDLQRSQNSNDWMGFYINW